MSKTIQTIAIIDSGIGGISVLKRLINKFRAGNYIYFADNLYMPYGNKSEKFLLSRVTSLIEMLKKQYCVDLVIIACNTASSIVGKLNLPNVITMQFKEDLPYLGTLLTKKMLTKCNVIADKTLAKSIEQNILNEHAIDKIVKQHVKKHNLHTLQMLGLGCTHYELVEDKFKKYCTNTKILCNSDYIIDNIKIESDELNVICMMSKYSYAYEQKLRKIIRG